MEFLVITGIAGAGKTVMHNALEDIGYYCVDNIPPQLLPIFYELCEQAENIERAAVVIDCRGFELFSNFNQSLEKLRSGGGVFKLVYVDCKTEVLINRFKETRRSHPMYDKCGYSISEAIHEEKALLTPAREQADLIIDTSNITTKQLRERVIQMFAGEAYCPMKIEIVSFGFKRGPLIGADMIFDVRCFPNPYYIPELRPLTGIDAPVRDYVLASDLTKGFLSKLCDMMGYLIPLYIAEGRSQLIIGIGCTGGNHRSVAISEALRQYLRSKGYASAVTHRDKDIKT